MCIVKVTLVPWWPTHTRVTVFLSRAGVVEQVKEGLGNTRRKREVVVNPTTRNAPSNPNTTNKQETKFDNERTKKKEQKNNDRQRTYQMFLPPRPIQRIVWIIARLRDKHDMRMFAFCMFQLAQIERRKDLFRVGGNASINISVRGVLGFFFFPGNTSGDLGEVGERRGVGVVTEERSPWDVGEVVVFKDSEAHGRVGRLRCWVKDDGCWVLGGSVWR